MNFVDPGTLPNGLQVIPVTIWREARGEGKIGMLAVAWVIHNRANHNHAWPRDPEKVCLHAWQFSCWNPEDPQRFLYPKPDDPAYLAAVQCWEAIWPEVDMGFEWNDPTGGATYYVEHTLNPNPRANEHFVQVAAIEHHLFYRDV